MPTPVIIDCDPGHDDAMALLLALASPELELVGRHHGGRQPDAREGDRERDPRARRGRARTTIPVAAGADRALIHPAGVGERGPRRDRARRPDLPPPSREPEPHARRRADRAPSCASARYTLIPIGPLTNIALLLAHPPRAARTDRADRADGRRDRPRQRHARAEFNVWADPEAAHRVFTLRARRDDGRARRHPPRDAVRRARRRAARRRAGPAPSSPTCTRSIGGSTGGLRA